MIDSALYEIINDTSKVAEHEMIVQKHLDSYYNLDKCQKYKYIEYLLEIILRKDNTWIDNTLLNKVIEDINKVSGYKSQAEYFEWIDLYIYKNDSIQIPEDLIEWKKRLCSN